MKKRKYNKIEQNIMDEHKRLIDLQNCGNADHLSDENGNFKSEHPGGDGTYSIGLLEDVCQWTYYRTDINQEQKLISILKIEEMIQSMLGGISNMNCKYIPTWSPKLK